MKHKKYKAIFVFLLTILTETLAQICNPSHFKLKPLPTNIKYPQTVPIDVEENPACKDKILYKFQVRLVV